MCRISGWKGPPFPIRSDFCSGSSPTADILVKGHSPLHREAAQGDSGQGLHWQIGRMQDTVIVSAQGGPIVIAGCIPWSFICVSFSQMPA